jgi:hypothetical protein
MNCQSNEWVIAWLRQFNVRRQNGFRQKDMEPTKLAYVERLGFCLTVRRTLGQESAAPIYVKPQIVDALSSSLKLILKVNKKNESFY